MTTEPACWRDFAHTASVKLASALAAHEVAAHDVRVRAAPTTRRVRQTFSFALLAAATGEAPKLPTGGYEAAEGGLVLSTALEGGLIRVALQLEGLDALEAGAGQDARIVSDDGALDTVAHFDAGGRAALQIADTDAHRVALTKLRVDVLADPEG